MAIAETIGALGVLFDVVRNVMTDIRSRRQDEVTRDLLRLKHRELLDALSVFRKDIAAEVESDKAAAAQDLASRGLYNTTLKDSTFAGIEKEAADRVLAVEKHVQQSAEELATMLRQCKK